MIQEIFPDTTRTFTASYDVPTDSKRMMLEVKDLKIPPEEKAYINLGI